MPLSCNGGPVATPRGPYGTGKIAKKLHTCAAFCRNPLSLSEKKMHALFCKICDRRTTWRRIYVKIEAFCHDYSEFLTIRSTLHQIHLTPTPTLPKGGSLICFIRFSVLPIFPVVPNPPFPCNSVTFKLRVYQNAGEAHCRDIFLYLSACNVLLFNGRLADKYKNMSLPSCFRCILIHPRGWAISNILA